MSAFRRTSDGQSRQQGLAPPSARYARGGSTGIVVTRENPARHVLLRSELPSPACCSLQCSPATESAGSSRHLLPAPGAYRLTDAQLGLPLETRNRTATCALARCKSGGVLPLHRLRRANQLTHRAPRYHRGLSRARGSLVPDEGLAADDVHRDGPKTARALWSMNARSRSRKS